MDPPRIRMPAGQAWPLRPHRSFPRGLPGEHDARVHTLMETASFGGSVQRFEEPEARALAGIFRFDPLLLLAGLGLIGCSVYVLSAATENDIPGSPHYYVIRQAVYGGVGIVLMMLLSRMDYSRLRELKLGIYGLMIALICLVFVIGAAARGSQRWI